MKFADGFILGSMLIILLGDLIMAKHIVYLENILNKDEQIIKELEYHVDICGQQITNLYYITDVLTKKDLR